VEAIDIENEEYAFWDAVGNQVRILVNGQQVDKIEHSHENMALHDAFARNAESLGINLDLAGSPAQVWSRLEEAKRILPRKHSFLGSLFRR
jgi:hypothetical protein